jgi:hypothetical protein
MRRHSVADHQQVADFIQQRVTLGRVRPGAELRSLSYYPTPYYGAPLPTVEQAGESFFQDAEFRALQLGGFLNTPGGDFLEQAVELVVPRVLAPEFDLLVEALKYASARQQGDTRGKAALAVGGTLLVAAIIREIAKAA